MTSNSTSKDGRRRVRVGLAGAGRRAAQYAQVLANAPDMQLLGVWGRSAGRAAALAECHGVSTYRTFDEMLAAVDGVVFAVPPGAQAEYAAAAAVAGRSLLLEAPMAADLGGAEELVAATVRGRAASQLALPWRYSAVVRGFLDVEVPRIRPQGGTGLAVVGRSEARRVDMSAWRLERSVLLDVGPHLVDVLDAALGPVVGERAHGNPMGWLGLHLEHSVGRASEVSLYPSPVQDSDRVGVEVFGPGGSADVDCATAAGPDAWSTMVAEFASVIRDRASTHSTSTAACTCRTSSRRRSAIS